MLRKYTGRDSRRVLGRFSRASKEMACACALWPVGVGHPSAAPLQQLCMRILLRREDRSAGVSFFF
jgi:hypothetical protein